MPTTNEGRDFAKLMAAPESPKYRRRERDGRAVTLDRGWCELYRDDALIALWPDFSAIDRMLRTAPCDGAYIFILRGPDGDGGDRWLVCFEPDGSGKSKSGRGYEFVRLLDRKRKT